MPFLLCECEGVGKSTGYCQHYAIKRASGSSPSCPFYSGDRRQALSLAVFSLTGADGGALLRLISRSIRWGLHLPRARRCFLSHASAQRCGGNPLLMLRIYSPCRHRDLSPLRRHAAGDCLYCFKAPTFGEEPALIARILGHVQQRLESDNKLARAPPGHQEPTFNLM